MESEQPNPYQPPNTPLAGEVDHRNRKFQDGDKLVILATFENSVEAHLLCGELNEQEIEAQVGNETSSTIFGAGIAGSSNAFSIKVLVMKRDLEKALEIKAEFFARKSDDPMEIPEWNCKCGEVVDEGFAVCWSCEAEYQPPAA